MFSSFSRRAPAAALLALVAALASSPIAPAAAGDASPRAPAAVAVAEPVYGDLEALAVRGLLDLPGLYARPVLAFDVARALQNRPAERPLELAADPTIRRASEAFALEMGVLAEGGSPAVSRALLSFRDADSWLRVESSFRARAEAAADRGFVLTDSTRFGLRFSWMVWPDFHLFEELYVADIEDGNVFGDPLKPGTNVVIFQDRVYGALHTRYTDIVLGRDRLAWGPGATGSLMMSRTARPFTQLRLSRSFLGGALHAVIVSGILNQNEHRYIGLHRLDWQLNRTLRFGFAEGVRYNAPGIEPLYLIGIVPYSIAERMLRRDNDARPTDAATRNNVMWAIDGTWRPRPGLQLYGEVLVDDIGIEDVDHPTRLGFQAGALAVREVLGHEMRARLEWTRVWNWVYSTFYAADFEHEGVPLGYPLGPDSRLLHARGDWIVSRGWSVGGKLERQDRGEGRVDTPWTPGDPSLAGARAGDFAGVVETQWRALLGARHTPNAYLDLEVEVGPTWIRNANHSAGEERRGLAGHLAFSYRY